MRDRNDPEHIEIAIWAEDSAKVERIIDRMQLDVVEAGEAEIMSDVTPEQPVPGQEAPERQPVQGADDASIPFGLDDPDGDLGFTQPAPLPAEPEDPPFPRSTPTSVPRSAPPSASKNRSPNISPTLRAVQARARGKRPSVREELRGIKAMLNQREAVAPQPKIPIRIHRGDRAR